MDRLEVSDLADRVRRCLEPCPCRKAARRPVPGEGPSSARYVFIGRNPGPQEDKRNRPFVGPSGQALDRFIQALGLTRPEVAVLNLVKCFTEGNREPLGKEVQECRCFVKDELAFFPDKRVLFLMGQTVARTFIKSLGDQSITRVEGKLFRSPKSEIICIPMTHPSYWLRNKAAGLMVFNRMVHEIRHSLEELEC